jgi:hypothetical protein
VALVGSTVAVERNGRADIISTYKTMNSFIEDPSALCQAWSLHGLPNFDTLEWKERENGLLGRMNCSVIPGAAVRADVNLPMTPMLLGSMSFLLR